MKKNIILTIVLFFLCHAAFSQKMSDATKYTKFAEFPNSDIVLADMLSADNLTVKKINSSGIELWKKQFKLDKPIKNSSQIFQVSTIALQENNIFLVVDSMLFKIDQNGNLAKKKILSNLYDKIVLDSANLYLYNQMNSTKQSDFVEKINLNTLTTVWKKELPKSYINTGKIDDIHLKNNVLYILKHLINTQNKHFIVKEFEFSQNPNDNNYKVDSIDFGLKEGKIQSVKYNQKGNFVYSTIIQLKRFDFIEMNKTGQIVSSISIPELYTTNVPLYYGESCDFLIDPKTEDIFVDYRYYYWKDSGNTYYARAKKNGTVLESCILPYNSYLPIFNTFSISDGTQLLFLRKMELMKSKKYCENSINTEDLAENHFEIFPNPSTGIFNVSTAQNATIQIFDALGSLILTKNISDGSEIDLGNANNGIYFYKIQSIDNQSVIKKGKLTKL